MRSCIICRFFVLGACAAIILITVAVVRWGDAGIWVHNSAITTFAASSSIANTRRNITTAIGTYNSKSQKKRHSLPILFLHGINGHAKEFDAIVDWIRSQPNAPQVLHSLDHCEGHCSLFTSMLQQRDDMIDYLITNADRLNITHGFHLVGHSQGALLARAVLQGLPPQSLQVHTYVGMAGPQRGQWGECRMGARHIPEWVERQMARPYGWLAFYNALAQHDLSVANYWHDPHHEDTMIERTRFLPHVNGYGGHIHMTKAKENFLRLQRAIFVGSPDDDCINPPLSSVFGYDDTNHSTAMKESMEYQHDTFGLRTMDERHRLVVQVVPGFDHESWMQPHVFEKYVWPYLEEIEEEEEPI